MSLSTLVSLEILIAGQFCASVANINITVLREYPIFLSKHWFWECKRQRVHSPWMEFWDTENLALSVFVFSAYYSFPRQDFT